MNVRNAAVYSVALTQYAMINMKFDENNYPMTYREFEKRVIELFLEDCSDDHLEDMRNMIEDEVKDENNFIGMLYGQSCFVYDHPELYGDMCKRCFEDSFLRQTPVAQLRLYL